MCIFERVNSLQQEEKRLLADMFLHPDSEKLGVKELNLKTNRNIPKRLYIHSLYSLGVCT
ncbi:hypothetical protein STEG23_021553, partial [Scotinomys teguina]